MSRREDFTRFYIAGTVLSMAILGAFQVYILREPTRIEAAEREDRETAVAAGRALYAENCAACHGEEGEGSVGPALNSKGLLRTTPDGILFALTRTGVPGTRMPAWGQAFGGPLTNEQVDHLVAYIRAWEPSAPEIESEVREPDAARGASLFASTCFICHGEDGAGTEAAPAINDLDRLHQFDDAWYRGVIANGRPAKGMPTWGTVLSPEQIGDLVALIGAWRRGETVPADFSVLRRVTSALYAVRQFDPLDAAFHIGAAVTEAEGPIAGDLRLALSLIEENRLYEAEALLIGLFPPEEMGRELFTTNCASCHGDDGTGKTGPNLRGNSFIRSRADDALRAFLLAGRRGTPMDGFEGILTEGEAANLVALLRTWQTD